MGGTIAQILIQGQIQSHVLGRQVGLFHQQQIYNNQNKNKVCKYYDGWDNAKKAKKLYFHCGPF